MINVYKPNGTEEGFFTAVFNAYPDKNAFIGGKDYITPLTDKEIPVVTDPVKAARVKNRLKIYDDASLRDIDYILRSDGKDKENVAFRYIRRICAEKCPVRKRFADRDVLNALRLIKKVSWEWDKMRGFLRFIEVSGGIMYAPYSPDCDLTEILVKHFIARFGKTPFIIHDKKRNIAAVYNGRDCIIIPFKDPELYLSDGEEEICRLWKEYYKSVNISSRPHEKQMKGSMPVRYWKYLPEKR